MHDTTQPSTRRRDQERCLRHHVWMAACSDCRNARRPRTGDVPEVIRAAS